MSTRQSLISAEKIDHLILTLRDQRVILASDLAAIYGVPAKALNQAVKRNAERFPADFMFQLTLEEAKAVQRSRSQTVTLKRGHNIKYLPYAFTEHGALQAANLLNSPRAVAMSIYVIRAFVKLREDQAANQAILKRLAEIDQTLLTHDTALRDVYRKLLPLLSPPPEPERPEIGFHVKEDGVPYRVKRKTVRS